MFISKRAQIKRGIYLVDKSTPFVLFTLCRNKGSFYGMLLFPLSKGCSFFITSVISPMYLLPMSHNINNPSYFSYKHKTTSIDQFATTNLVNMHSFVTLNWWQHRTPRLPILERECTLRGATLAHSFLKIANFVVPHFYQFANLAW